MRGRQPCQSERIQSVGNPIPVEPPRPHTTLQTHNLVLSSLEVGFKDILDAQSEFIPLDFKSRIKASGARDYGEDVADRNIGVNGHNLELPQVQAFYAQSTDSHPLPKSKGVPIADMPRPYQGDVAAQSHTSKPPSLGAGLGTKSPDSSSACAYQHGGTPHVPHLPQQKPTMPRQDLAQRPTTSETVPQHQSSRKNAKTNSDMGYASPRSKVRRLAYRGGPALPLTPLRNSPDLSADRSGPVTLELHPALRPTAVEGAGAGPGQASKGHNASTTLADQQIESADEVHARKGEHGIRPPSSQRAFSLKPSTKRRSCTISSATSSTKGYNAYFIRSSVASSAASFETAIDTTAPVYHIHPQPADPTKAARRASIPSGFAKVDSHDTVITHTAPSPRAKSATARHDLGNVNDTHQHRKSLTSELKTDDLPEVIPPRSSSLRNWSISSTTPTASDTSSNPFQRPQSRNTATTSVDLGKDFLLKTASQLSIGHVRIPPSAEAPQSTSLNIDDYTSSDDDSLEPRIPRGAGEEELLFSTSGYGPSSQLPGLFDALTSSPPRHIAITDDSLSSRPRSSASSSSANYSHKPFSTPGGALSPRRRYILDTAADSDSDSDSDFDDAQTWHGGGDAYTTSGMSLSPARRIRHTRRLSALGSHYPAPDVIEEERDWGKIDVAAAVRQRKEEKARKRAAATSTRRRVPKGKGKERGMGVEGDAGRWADVEC